MAVKEGKAKVVLSDDSAENLQVQMLDIDEIRPFRNHPFHLYEAVAGPQPVVDPVIGVVAPPPVYKPVKLPGSMREKYFADMEQKEIEEVLDKLLAAWLKRKKRQER